ncbi:MAG: GNAT family N-acetyltransferase [Terriglobales bacterium]
MTGARPISPPERLAAAHCREGFDCGEPSLNEWLRRRALKNDEAGASRTYVACQDSRVIGYYSLVAGSMMREQAPGRVRRNMPDPIPVIVLARLAVDRRFQRLGVGSELLHDAVLRCLQAAGIAGVRAILVHTLSDDAKSFYQKHGFIASPADPSVLMITAAEAIRERED